MKLIVGLGNPGPQYARTRHNAGFMVLDQLAKAQKETWKPKSNLRSDLIISNITNPDSLTSSHVILAKPHTYMNASGEAVQRLMQYYVLKSNDVWVVFDDVDVPFGRLRIRQGSTSGQQGIRSIIQHIGNDFYQFRFGLSLNDRNREPSEQYVLKPFNPAEREQLPTALATAADVLCRQLALESPEETTFDLMQAEK